MSRGARGRGVDIEGDIVALEGALSPLFEAGQYREFFDQAHAVRQRFKTERLSHTERERLWQRLNRCTEAAKERQAREFAARRNANLARWAEQAETAQTYILNLRREIAELQARTGPPAELARWQRRIVEKQARLASVEGNLTAIRGKMQT